MSENNISLREHIEALREADKVAISAALAAAKEAVLKKEEEVERWRANANEWRGAMNDRERDFLTRREFYVMVATAITVIGFILGFVRK